MIKKNIMLLNVLFCINCTLTLLINTVFILATITDIQNKEETIKNVKTITKEKLNFKTIEELLDICEKVYKIEDDITYAYLLKLMNDEDEENDNCIDSIFIFKKCNKRKRNININEIKTIIKEKLKQQHIDQTEHKIDSMSYRIYQRIKDYNSNISSNTFNFFLLYTESDFAKLLLQKMKDVINDENYDIINDFKTLKNIILKYKACQHYLNEKEIENIICRIIQRVSDLVYSGSSNYNDLKQIKIKQNNQEAAKKKERDVRENKKKINQQTAVKKERDVEKSKKQNNQQTMIKKEMDVGESKKQTNQQTTIKKEIDGQKSKNKNNQQTTIKKEVNVEESKNKHNQPTIIKKEIVDQKSEKQINQQLKKKEINFVVSKKKNNLPTVIKKEIDVGESQKIIDRHIIIIKEVSVVESKKEINKPAIIQKEIVEKKNEQKMNQPTIIKKEVNVEKSKKKINQPTIMKKEVSVGESKKQNN
ncbi:hypothetical protein HEP_00353700 [Hepatocystis sp. ex Piliocolobus tephrosceles]|nr:hypothetical protein HEP_00353700 [Hepatocystis sp. ex Piliocolobus tephrosceles]